MKLLSIMTAIAFISANTMADDSCKPSLTFEQAPHRACLTKKTANDIKQCLKKFIAGLESIDTRNDNIVLHLSKPVCIFGSYVYPGDRNVQINVTRAGKFVKIIDFRTDLTIGTITYSGYSACGWTPNGKSRLPLTAEFSLIPPNTKIKVSTSSCKGDVIDPGNSVELDEAASVCDATLPKGTKFSYMPDGAYHFVALSNTKMLYADPDSQSETLIVERGKDYRNFDPAKSPCIWSETPADVLKSFHDGTPE